MRIYQQDLELLGVCPAELLGFFLVRSSSLSILPALRFRGRKDFSCRDGSDLGDMGSVSSFAQITFVT